MAEGIARDARLHDILKGRLALALVSARAEKCPNRRCGRARHCLATVGEDFNFHRPHGDCPIMTDDEWRAASIGMQRSLKRVEPSVRADLRAEEDAVAALPKAEREAARARRVDVRPEPIHYWNWLWVQFFDGRVGIPDDIAACERSLIGRLSRAGCRCAKERRIGECDRC